MMMMVVVVVVVVMMMTMTMQLILIICQLLRYSSMPTKLLTQLPTIAKTQFLTISLS
jgi:hypothetical protein